MASGQVYIVITKLALSSRDVEIISTTAQLFHVLNNGEAEGLLDSKLFARSLLDLVHYGSRYAAAERLETELVELLFEIAMKIRADPDILPAWFYPERETAPGRALFEESRRGQFPLFYELVQYVHHDGAIGDFARTALLYLTETASKWKPLETWMIESELAPQMASGLGALYSRLSRQFQCLGKSEGAPPIVRFSDASSSEPLRIESAEDGQHDVKAFLSYLAFWQDTLNHCKSAEVSDTLLDHFQVLFVQQLLYPSLLESSDVEGGSTAAVIAHLGRVLLAVDHEQLVERMLRYLLSSKGPERARDQPRRRPRMSMSRRKSIDHLKALSEAADSPSPDLFNLLDLMVLSLKSRHSETVNTCLKLLSVIVEKHHRYVLTNLFRTEVIEPEPADRSVQVFHNTLVRLFALAAAVADSPTMDDSYQAGLIDGQVLLEQHSCFVKGPIGGDEEAGPKSSAISHDCKLFAALISLLRTFFANDTVTNLYLTEAIMSLAACEHLSLRGWLLPAGDEVLHDEPDSFHSVTLVLAELVSEVRQWRSRFVEWNDLISRRRAELTEEDRADMAGIRTLSGGETKDASGGRRPDSPVSIHHSQPSSRPTTPKGQKIPRSKFGSIDGALSASPSWASGMADGTMAGSPLRKTVRPSEQTDVESTRKISSERPSLDTAILETQIQLAAPSPPDQAVSSSLSLLAGRIQSSSPSAASLHPPPGDGGESGTATPSVQDEAPVRTHASLNHILTNAIILQEFLLEVAAVVQLRATFFDEVDLQA